MIYGSLFTGIGGFDLALDRCGMECAWQVEINPYRRKVLEKHWPDVERFEDVREVGRHNLKPVDLICGGFPCQDLSVAGKRGGLKAERSGLFFEFARIVGELQPAWFIVENVFGLLSSEAGRDFTIVLSTLDDLGYGLAWRVLDSRYFGVAQRRRRVYVVGYLGAPCPYEILFEPKDGEGDIAEGGEAGEEIAHALTTRAGGGREREGTYIAESLEGYQHGYSPRTGKNIVASTLSTTHGGGRRRSDDENLVAGESLSYALRGSRRGQFSGSQAPDDSPDDSGVRDNREQARGVGQTPERSGGAPGHGEEVDPNRVRETPGVPRRVDLPVREEPGEVCTCPDTPRYQALGDAVTVNVVEWIGRRIAEVSA